MSNVQVAGGATALADPPGSVEDEFTVDEFALDVRVVLAYGPAMGDCPTDDGCGNTCQGDASACNSQAASPF